MLNSKQRVRPQILIIFVLFFALVLSPNQTYAVSNTNDAGTVIAWGLDSLGQSTVPSGLSEVLAMDGGWYHSVAVKQDGTVIAWGKNDFGETDVPPGLSNVVEVAAGWHHTVALKEDGTIVAWGQNQYGQLDIPAGLTSVKAIGAGWHNTVALKEDGTVVAWGSNVYGESTVPAGLSNVTAIATSWAHILALKEDGTVVGWGIELPHTEVPGEVSDIIAIDAGGVHSIVLKADGTVFAWGENNYGQIDIPSGLSDVVAISAGRWHNMALKSNGEIATWGLNLAGQLNVPDGLHNVVAIATGGEHSMALVYPLNRPPVCTEAIPSIETIWPPNHKFVPVEILNVTDPEGDPIVLTIDSIFQDEPVDTYGDGKHVPDANIVALDAETEMAELRAERSGTKKVPGNGRVYHITFTADDGHGGTCEATVHVGVPHDVKDIPVDEGPLYDSTIAPAVRAFSRIEDEQLYLPIIQ